MIQLICQCVLHLDFSFSFINATTLYSNSHKNNYKGQSVYSLSKRVLMLRELTQNVSDHGLLVFLLLETLTQPVAVSHTNIVCLHLSNKMLVRLLDHMLTDSTNLSIWSSFFLKQNNPNVIYRFKVNNGNTKTMQWNKFKVNNKDTRAATMTSSLCLYCYLASWILQAFVKRIAINTNSISIR